MNCKFFPKIFTKPTLKSKYSRLTARAEGLSPAPIVTMTEDHFARYL
jgi:hypothetical protein